MASIDATCREVMEKSEWVAIATTGPDGPHLAATWGDYIRALGIRDDLLLIPAGMLNVTEQNLQHDPRIELLFASRQVHGTYGPGRGCCVKGRAHLVTTGDHFAAVKAKYPWARAALVVQIDTVRTQL